MAIALLVLILLVPALLRFLRAVFKVHLCAVVLFLPAGLLLRFGGNEDMRTFALVTACWACVLAGWRIARWRAGRRAASTRPGAHPRFHAPHRERLT